MVEKAFECVKHSKREFSLEVMNSGILEVCCLEEGKDIDGRVQYDYVTVSLNKENVLELIKFLQENFNE